MRKFFIIFAIGLIACDEPAEIYQTVKKEMISDNERDSLKALHTDSDSVIAGIDKEWSDRIERQKKSVDSLKLVLKEKGIKE